MRRRILAALAVAAAVTVTACSDTTDPGGARRIRPPSGIHATASLDDEIQSMIVALFPQGLETAAGTRWEGITYRLSTGDVAGARSKYFELAQWVMAKAPQMVQPATGTRQSAAGQLVLYMSLYVFGGPSTPLPVLGGDDIAIGFITPDAGGTVITPSLRAAVAVPPGAVDQLTTVIVWQPAPPPGGYGYCDGPLPTTLCQYPYFYRFEPFPYQILNQPARFGVCHVTQGEDAPTPSIHDRFRLAHQYPSDPSYTPIAGSQHVDGIEILPLTSVSDLLDCHPTQTGMLNGSPLLQRGWLALSGAARSVGNIFLPRVASAIDLGGGGSSEAFSDFNVVDPTPSTFIDFETYNGGPSSPACDAGCALTTAYSSQGVSFGYFVVGQTYDGIPPVWLSSSINTPTNTPTFALTPPPNPPETGGGYPSGTFTISAPTTTTELRFVMRVNNDVGTTLPLVIRAYDANNAPIAAGQIARASHGTYTIGTGTVVYRQDGITITNPGGISRVEIDMLGWLGLVDDLALYPAYTPPILY